MFCTNCGAPIDDDGKFCPVCGAPVEENETPVQMEKKGKIGILIGCIGAGIVLAVGISLFAAWRFGMFGGNHHRTSGINGGIRESIGESYSSESPVDTESIAPEDTQEASQEQTQETDQSQSQEQTQTENQEQTQETLAADFEFSDEKWSELSCAGAQVIMSYKTSLDSGELLDGAGLDESVYASLNVSGTAADGTAPGELRLFASRVEDNMVITDTELIVSNGSGVYSDGLYRVWWRPDQKSRLGYTIARIQSIPQASPQVTEVEASSTLPTNEWEGKYQASNILDRDLTTAWVEGASGYGIGESIQMNFDSTQALHGLRIAGGYRKTQATYTENARVTAYRLEFSDGTSMDVVMGSYPADGKTIDSPIGVNGWETALAPEGRDWAHIWPGLDFISFGREVMTDYVRITILDVEPGTLYEDTCITEVEVY